MRTRVAHADSFDPAPIERARRILETDMLQFHRRKCAIAARPKIVLVKDACYRDDFENVRRPIVVARGPNRMFQGGCCPTDIL